MQKVNIFCKVRRKECWFVFCALEGMKAGRALLEKEAVMWNVLYHFSERIDKYLLSYLESQLKFVTFWCLTKVVKGMTRLLESVMPMAFMKRQSYEEFTLDWIYFTEVFHTYKNLFKHQQHLPPLANNTQLTSLITVTCLNVINSHLLPQQQQWQPLRLSIPNIFSSRHGVYRMNKICKMNKTLSVVLKIITAFI